LCPYLKTFILSEFYISNRFTGSFAVESAHILINYGTKIYSHSVNGPLYNHSQLNGPDDKYVSRFRMDEDTKAS
jgi:hypothetical protein